MEIIFEILISILIPLFFIIKPLKEAFKNKKRIKNLIKEYSYEIVIFFIIFTGSLIRFIGLSSFPHGLNPDETSSGYEAWSILNYGIDRNLKSFPVFLISWGSGQNALYSYLLMPFIKIFGLTEFATRLPMAIISSISLIVIYYLFKELFNKKIGLVAAFFLAICPWHIMKSRYGLESNIFPDIILLATTLIIFYIKNEKIKYLYIALALLRNICIFIWNIIFLFTIFCNSIFNIFFNCQENNYKECLNIYNDFRNNRYADNYNGNNKYI